MTRHEKASTFSRRSVLKAGGAVVVSLGAPLGLDTVIGITEAAVSIGKLRPEVSVLASSA